MNCISCRYSVDSDFIKIEMGTTNKSLSKVIVTTIAIYFSYIELYENIILMMDIIGYIHRIS